MDAIRRTSTRRVSLPPTRSKSCSCKKRRSFTWQQSEISETSSSKSVPPSACSKRPSRRVMAPLNAPRSCPNSSRSRMESARAAQLSLTKGPLARGESAWMAAAASSFPVPVSPLTSTVTVVGATCSIMLRTRCMDGWSPTMLARAEGSSGWIGVGRRVAMRSWTFSSVRSMTETSAETSRGFSR